MKTALIAGVCLLAFTCTISDALLKKQDVDCDNPGDEVQACVDASNAMPIDKNTLCTARCRSALEEYFEDCFEDFSDELNKEYDRVCSAAGTVATLFTLVSAILVAVGN